MSLTGFPAWSQTAASNGNADPTVNYLEGQAPSSVNDSARAAMAALAKYRDDTRGNIITSGTASAYTLVSNQDFTTLPDLNGNAFTFIVHATNGPNPTLNMNGLGAFLLTIGDQTVPAGSLIINGVYRATFYNSVGEWRLHDFYVDPFGVPLGGLMDYIGPTVPNSNFAFPIGQGLSTTTYASLFALIGYTYGGGGSTFNLPDLTGRVTAMKEAVATRLTAAVGGVDGATLGSAAGGQSQVLTLAQIPGGITSSNTATVGVSVLSTLLDWLRGGVSDNYTSTAGTGTFNSPVRAQIASSGTIGVGAISVTSNNTGGLAHPNVQPTIILNKIVRIL